MVLCGSFALFCWISLTIFDLCDLFHCSAPVEDYVVTLHKFHLSSPLPAPLSVSHPPRAYVYFLKKMPPIYQ